VSHESTLTIAGDNDLASESARHAISAGLGDPVYLWRSIQDPLVSAAQVVILADAEERAGFAATALEAGLKVISLPIRDLDDDLTAAIRDGRLQFMSRLHGLPTLARLQHDARPPALGRRYGVFAAHRLPATFADDLDDTVDDLVTYCCSLIDAPLTRISATAADLGTPSTAGWFVLARFADDTIATIEVSAVLPDAGDPNGELTVEVTGSDSVLRAVPEQQSVVINGSQGFQRSAWYADPSAFLLQRATQLLEHKDTVGAMSAALLIQRRLEASRMEQALEL
jgi:hypothetical protein